MGFPRQEDWNGLLFPSPGDLPETGIEPMSPALAGRFFATEHHISKTSILQRSAFFTVQLSHPYMTTGKTIALTRRQSNVSAFEYAI